MDNIATLCFNIGDDAMIVFRVSSTGKFIRMDGGQGYGVRFFCDRSRRLRSVTINEVETLTITYDGGQLQKHVSGPYIEDIQLMIV
jgi:hypothetical protein